MFIRAKDDSGSITLEVMARGFGQQPVKGRPQVSLLGLMITNSIAKLSGGGLGYDYSSS
jgi:hypothetical protein